MGWLHIAVGENYKHLHAFKMQGNCQIIKILTASSMYSGFAASIEGPNYIWLTVSILNS